jgi:hypothetical protein
MGTLLKTKWDFARRNETLDAYLKVFGKESRNELTAIFRNPELNWFAAVRNVLVHNAGVADAEFTKRVAKHPELGKLREGQEVVVDGVLCQSFLRVWTQCANSLIVFVDEWLSRNP